MEFVIGCDVGTQSVKAVLLSHQGTCLGQASATYPVHYPHPAWAEQDAEDWLRGLEQAIADLLQATPVERSAVRAIALATQVDGLLALGRDGLPLRRAIIWMDRRATGACAALAEREDELFRLSGLNLDPSHVAPKARWLAQHEPQVYAKVEKLLLPGSYLGYALTGELAVDYSNASSSLLMDVRSRAWSGELCRAFGVSPELLVPIKAANTPLGTLRPEVAERLGLSPDTLVMVGCGDEHAACLGAGVIEPGLICDIAGTAEPVCAASPLPYFDEQKLVETHCHADPGTWLLENPGFVSGANYRWFRDQFGQPEQQEAQARGVSAYELLNQMAAAVPAGSEGVIFLPCLMGAMTPTWNPQARGTFFGFTLAHRREHFLRALLEGSAYAVRDITDRMAQMGLAACEIRAVGGGAKGRLWRQIKADVTGLPVTLTQTPETTALGAGMLALNGIGAFDSLSAAARAAVRVVETVEPRPAERERYEAYYQLYRSTYQALLPVFGQGAQIPSGQEVQP